MTIYLDYQASTPIDPRVKALMIDVMETEFANPSSESHSAGWRARELIEKARNKIATAISCDAEEIIFTSGATEADNIGVLGAALAAPAGRSRILVGATEHKAVLEPAMAAARFGYSVEILPVDRDGVIDRAALKGALNDQTAVVSIMLANNEIGTIQKIEELGPIISQAGAFFHTDATQAPTAMSLDIETLHVDAASFSSHKIYGPKGVGGLYLSNAAPWRPKPVMFGGGQEGGLRPGTIPTALCVGFAEAFSILVEEGQAERRRVANLRDYFVGALQSRISGCRLTTSMNNHHPCNLHLRFEGVDAGDLLDRLQPKVAAARGSACTSGEANYSHVLKAIGMNQQKARQCIRFSIGRFTTEEEVDIAVSQVQSATTSIRTTAQNSPKLG